MDFAVEISLPGSPFLGWSAERCYYHDGIPALPAMELTEDTTADVCIIGGGFSGLSAAHHLREAGLDVVVLEREHVGWGASGRNGGQLLHGFNQSLGWLIERLGDKDAVSLWLDTLNTIRTIAARVQSWGIPCEWQEGVFIAARNAAGLAALREETALWARHLGHEVKPLAHEETRALLGTSIYAGGALDYGGRHFHPYKYAQGFARGLLERGVRVFCHSPALKVDGQVVHTASAKVTAGKIIYCGNAYQGMLLPKFRERVVVLQTSMLATAPLPAVVARNIMAVNTSVYEWRKLLNYFRMTEDGRFLFGGGDSPLSSGQEADANVYTGLRKAMVQTFPQLRDIEVTHFWSGSIAMTTTNMPYIGEADENAYFIGGYCGHGIVPAHMLGQYAAEAVLGRTEKMERLSRLTPMKIPGGGSLDGMIGRMGLIGAHVEDKWEALKSLFLVVSNKNARQHQR